MTEGCRRALGRRAFDGFAPLYRDFLWPIDELIINDARLAKAPVLYSQMDEFYRFLTAEATLLKGFQSMVGLLLRPDILL